MRWNIFGEPTSKSEDCQASAADPTTQAVLTGMVGDRGIAEIDLAESIFGEIFTTGSRINVLTAHAHTLSSQKSPKIVSCARNDRVLIAKRVPCPEFKCDVGFQTGSSNMVETAHTQ